LDWCKENLAGNLYIWWLNKKTWGPVKMFPEKPIQWCICGSPIFLHCVAKNSERWYNPDSVSYPGRQCDSKWLQITFALHWLLSSFNLSEKMSLHYYPGMFFLYKRTRYPSDMNFPTMPLRKPSDILHPWTPSNQK
jgi:hypothetical protein